MRKTHQSSTRNQYIPNAQHALHAYHTHHASHTHHTQHAPSWKKVIAGQALATAASTVKAALAVEFAQEPLVSQEVSRIVSVVASVCKRHGPLIEASMAEALIKSDRLVVLRNVKLPVSEAARSLVASGKINQVASLSLDLDGAIVDEVDVDLIVIDEAHHWAAALQVKRGNGATEPGKRKRIENGLLAAEITLPSYLRRNGFPSVDMGVAAIVDYYGNSAFRQDMTLNRDDLDGFFGIEVVADIEAMSAAIRDALDNELPRLFAPLIAKTKISQSASLSLDADMKEGLLSTLLSADGLPPDLNRLQALRRPVDIEPQVNTKPLSDIKLCANSEPNADITSCANSEPRVKRKYTKRVHKPTDISASYSNQTISSNALPITSDLPITSALPINSALSVTSDLPINSSPIAPVKTGVRLWATDRRGQRMAASMRGASSSFQTDRMTTGIIHTDMMNTGRAS